MKKNKIKKKDVKKEEIKKKEVKKEEMGKEKIKKDEIKKDEIKAVLTDWRVLLLLALIVLSIIAIYPHIENGKLVTSLQFGLELSGGTWLQMELQAEVVQFQTSRPTDQFVSDLEKALDADVILVSQNQMEIRKSFTQEQLDTALSAAGGKLISYNPGVAKSTSDDIKRILEEKLNTLGTRDARVYPLSSLSGITQFVRVELAGVDRATAEAVVGKQGKFEIRVQTAANETEHVLYGDAITSVSTPSQQPAGSGNWGVAFSLDNNGATAFRNAALQYGAVDNPKSHKLSMLLDNQTFYTAPLSDDLAAKLRTDTLSQLYASTGSGTAGMNEAMTLEIHLRAGALPIAVTTIGWGDVKAQVGEQYKYMSLIAGMFALLAVGLVIFYRYREPSIVLPMVLINASEILILLGVARFIQQLDLPSIAGLIAVLGTGIDQLVIITDEVLHEGRVPSPSLYLKRLSRAVAIIVVSASTVLIAMLPLALMNLQTLRGFAIVTILGTLFGVLITRPAYGRIIMGILSQKGA